MNKEIKAQHNALQRFSNRVENYLNFRPGYPTEMVEILEKNNVLLKGNKIADVGSGTGFSAKPFLEKGYTVIGVEPNDEMRDAGEKYLSKYSDFISVNGTSENTTLENDAVDLIVAGQAFHWFNSEQSRKEFKRILKPEGNVVLIWNDRIIKGDQFHEVYEDFLQMFATDYKEVNHKNLDDGKIIQEFFGKENRIQKAEVDNFQELDFAGLKGRVLSSSYMPEETHKDFEYMIYVLKKIFVRFQENGKIKLKYNTRLFYGKIED